MRGRWSTSTLAVALAVCVSLTLSDGTAMAGKSKKNAIVTKVKGDKISWKGGDVSIAYDAGSFFVSGIQTVKNGKLSRVIGFGCPIDLEAATFPLTSIYCAISYTETKLKTVPKVRSWYAGTGFELTIKSFDGKRLVGKLEALLTPLSGSSKELPLSVRFKGKAVAD